MLISRSFCWWQYQLLVSILLAYYLVLFIYNSDPVMLATALVTSPYVRTLNLSYVCNCDVSIYTLWMIAIKIGTRPVYVESTNNTKSRQQQSYVCFTITTVHAALHLDIFFFVNHTTQAKPENLRKNLQTCSTRNSLEGKMSVKEKRVCEMNAKIKWIIIYDFFFLFINIFKACKLYQDLEK